MQFYKRQVGTLEPQLEDLKKYAVHHGDHIRAVDAWISQVRSSFHNDRMC